MTEAEARALLQSAKNGELCVRYVFEEQGNVFFSDTPRLVQPSFLNRAKRVAAIAAAVTVPMTIGCSGLSNGADGSSGSSGHMMGGIGPSDDQTIAQPLHSDASMRRRSPTRRPTAARTRARPIRSRQRLPRTPTSRPRERLNPLKSRRSRWIDARPA